MERGSQNHDIVVVGASSGGLKVLETLLRDLPAGLPAALFVVLHMGNTSHLAHVLGRSSRWPVITAVSGMRFEYGRVYVARPGAHLLLHDQHLLLSRGPRENMARPAIDPLFRSAALTFGSRVIGVVLSGSLSDGTAGLRAIKTCGGMAVVQEPADAAVANMPASALRHVTVDHVVPASELAGLIGRLVQEAPGPSPEPPLNIRMETAIAAQDLVGMKVEDQLGTPSRFTCPECHGALWEIEDGALLRFRCHVGHAYVADTALEAKTEEVDRLLNTLLRSYQERAALARRLASKERANRNVELARRFARRAEEYEADVEMVRRLFVNDERSSEMLSSEGGGGDIGNDS